MPRASRTGSSGWGGGQEREGWWGRGSYSPFSFVIIGGVIAGGVALGRKERRWCWHHPPPRGLRGCVTTFSTTVMQRSVCQRDGCTAQVLLHMSEKTRNINTHKKGGRGGGEGLLGRCEERWRAEKELLSRCVWLCNSTVKEGSGFTLCAWMLIGAMGLRSVTVCQEDAQHAFCPLPCLLPSYHWTLFVGMLRVCTYTSLYILCAGSDWNSELLCHQAHCLVP